MEPAEAYYCSLCDIRCNSEITFSAHYHSHGHQRKMKESRANLTPPPVAASDDANPPVSGDEGTNTDTAAGNGSVGFGIAQEELDYCGICDITFNHPTPARQHYQGAKHLQKKLKLQNPKEVGIHGECKLCNKVFVGPMQADAHYNSKKHQDRIEAANKEPAEGKSVVSDCKLCNKILLGQIQVDAHFSSKKHLEKVESANKPVAEPVIFGECTLCNKKFPSENQSKSHYESKKHLDKVKAAENPAEEKKPFGECTLCAKVFPFELQAKAHYESKKHLQKVRAKDIEEGKIVEDAPADAADGNDSTAALYGKCDLCQKKFPSKVQADSHYASKKHIQKVELEKLRCAAEKEALEKDDGEKAADTTVDEAEGVPDLKSMDNAEINKLVSTTMNCPFCSKTFSGYQPVKDHLTSKKHVQRVNRVKLNPELTPFGSPTSGTTNALGSVCEDISLDECGPSEEQIVFGEILDECILDDIVVALLKEIEHESEAADVPMATSNNDQAIKTRKRSVPLEEPPAVPVRQSKRRNCK